MFLIQFLKEFQEKRRRFSKEKKKKKKENFKIYSINLSDSVSESANWRNYAIAFIIGVLYLGKIPFFIGKIKLSKQDFFDVNHKPCTKIFTDYQNLYFCRDH